MSLLIGRRRKLYHDFLAHLGSEVELSLEGGERVRGRIEAVNRETVELRDNGRANRVAYTSVDEADFGPRKEASSAQPAAAKARRIKKAGRNSVYRSTVKTTLQLPEPAITRLDEIIPQLRKQLPREDRSFVTKGAIIDIMTEIGLEDLLSRGGSSRVVLRMMEKLDNRQA